jgi:hypothetical protein
MATLSEAIRPMSRICVQRKLNQPLRMIRHFLSVANWRATASMPKVPLPGTTMAAVGVVDRLDDPRDVVHHALEAPRHVVQGAVGIDHRVFEQTIGIGLGKECRHDCLHCGDWASGVE